MNSQSFASPPTPPYSPSSTSAFDPFHRALGAARPAASPAPTEKLPSPTSPSPSPNGVFQRKFKQPSSPAENIAPAHHATGTRQADWAGGWPLAAKLGDNELTKVSPSPSSHSFPPAPRHSTIPDRLSGFHGFKPPSHPFTGEADAPTDAHSPRRESPIAGQASFQPTNIPSGLPPRFLKARERSSAESLTINTFSSANAQQKCSSPSSNQATAGVGARPSSTRDSLFFETSLPSNFSTLSPPCNDINTSPSQGWHKSGSLQRPLSYFDRPLSPPSFQASPTSPPSSSHGGRYAEVYSFSSLEPWSRVGTSNHSPGASARIHRKSLQSSNSERINATIKVQGQTDTVLDGALAPTLSRPFESSNWKTVFRSNSQSQFRRESARSLTLDQSTSLPLRPALSHCFSPISGGATPSDASILSSVSRYPPESLLSPRSSSSSLRMALLRDISRQDEEYARQLQASISAEDEKRFDDDRLVAELLQEELNAGVSISKSIKHDYNSNILDIETTLHGPRDFHADMLGLTESEYAESLQEAYRQEEISIAEDYGFALAQEMSDQWELEDSAVLRKENVEECTGCAEEFQAAFLIRPYGFRVALEAKRPNKCCQDIPTSIYHGLNATLVKKYNQMIAETTSTNPTYYLPPVKPSAIALGTIFSQTTSIAILAPLFGDTYHRAQRANSSEEFFKSKEAASAASYWGTSVVGSVIQSYGVAALINSTGTLSYKGSAYLGSLIFMASSAPSFLAQLFTEQRPFDTIAVSAVARLFETVGLSMLLTWWGTRTNPFD
ncbi:MAG: hypothetical protein M1829_001292 [Trizodia sp. TS-e1964]|nr:MAG: hypothetical protein M1829_001292 [Trizodia sp. TS-e1964]